MAFKHFSVVVTYFLVVGSMTLISSTKVFILTIMYSCGESVVFWTISYLWSIERGAVEAVEGFDE